jgi:hypothetical protein
MAEPEQDDISSLCLVNGCLNEDEGAKADIETKEEMAMKLTPG